MYGSIADDVFRKNIVTSNYYPIVIPHWGKEVDHNFFSGFNFASGCPKKQDR